MSPITQGWLKWIGLNLPRDVREAAGYTGIIYEDAKFHPLFLYESLWSILAFIVLLWLFNNHRDKFRVGDFFLLFVAQYSFIRFLLEFIRVETTMLPGSDLNLSQVVTAVAFVMAVLLLLVRGAGRQIDGYHITPMKVLQRESEPEVVEETG